LIFIELNMETTQNQSLFRVKKLDLFILDLEPGKWISTFKMADKVRTSEPDQELIEIVKQWIDADYMWPKYYLEFNQTYTKFHKKEY